MKYIRELIGNREIRRKLLFTLFILFIYRVLANIPLPGIDMQVYQEQFATRSTSEANFLLSIFTGGLIETPSIVGLGIGVYISASIIMQLLSSVIPKLEELSKEGNRGKQVIDQYTRFLTVPLAIVQSLAFLLLISQQTLGFADDGSPLYLIPRTLDGGIAPTKLAFMALTLVAGSLLIMWLAELITEKGIANGASIMIMLGILATLPAYLESDLSVFSPVDTVVQAIQTQDLSLLANSGVFILLAIIIGFLLMLAAIVFVTESTRKLPIQYGSRQRSGFVQQSFLPLKLTQTGVMPIIFASALMTLPQLLVPVLSNVVDPNSPVGDFIIGLNDSFFFQTSSTAYAIVYFFLIIIFALFYVFVAFKPQQVAENLQKSGAFIPSVRPGKSTEDYISTVLIRLTTVGAIFLAAIALVPIVAGGLLLSTTGQSFSLFSALGGTSILIVVGVVLEASRQINASRASQNYEKYAY